MATDAPTRPTAYRMSRADGRVFIALMLGMFVALSLIHI